MNQNVDKLPRFKISWQRFSKFVNPTRSIVQSICIELSRELWKRVILKRYKEAGKCSCMRIGTTWDVKRGPRLQVGRKRAWSSIWPYCYQLSVTIICTSTFFLLKEKQSYICSTCISRKVTSEMPSEKESTDQPDRIQFHWRRVCWSTFLNYR